MVLNPFAFWSRTQPWCEGTVCLSQQYHCLTLGDTLNFYRFYTQIQCQSARTCTLNKESDGGLLRDIRMTPGEGRGAPRGHLLCRGNNWQQTSHQNLESHQAITESPYSQAKPKLTLWRKLTHSQTAGWHSKLDTLKNLQLAFPNDPAKNAGQPHRKAGEITFGDKAQAKHIHMNMILET